MNQIINSALTQETPGKVMGLLGAAMFSLAFMLSVSLSNASFSGMQQPLPDTFSMENVSTAVDFAAAGYSHFLAVNLFDPARQTYAIYSDNIGWVADNSGINYALGLDSQSQNKTVSLERVAGATTYRYTDSSGGILDGLYNALIK